MFTNKRTKNLNFDKVKINKIPIEYSDGASYLGTFLDAKLTFKKHIEDKIKKMQNTPFCIKKKVWLAKGGAYLHGLWNGPSQVLSDQN